MPTAKGTTHKSYENVIGDAEDFSPELITSIFENFSYTKEIFIWGADYFSELLPNKNTGSWIVWDKRKEGGTDKLFGSSFELCWSKAKHKRDIARILWAGYFGMGGEDTKTRIHPTQKPVELARWFFERWGKDGDIVVDVFAGSGFSIVACENLSRKCRAIEISPNYCAVILERMSVAFPDLLIEKIESV
jgi:DNA modification methylase